jgi:hypothetical protein
MFGHSRFCPFRGWVLFEVRSFEVQSLSSFGHSRFGPFRRSVIRGLVIRGSVFRRSAFRGSVFRGSVIRGSVTGFDQFGPASLRSECFFLAASSLQAVLPKMSPCSLLLSQWWNSKIHYSVYILLTVRAE